MSFLVDTNILVYASVEDSEFHKKAVEFIRSCETKSETWCISWVNIFEYLRVVTHSAVFKNPMPQELAEKNIRQITSLPNVEILSEEKNFFEFYMETTREAGRVTGNLVHDAHIAALMRVHGVKKIYTLDTQFRIFPFLTVLNPFSG